MTTDRVNNNWHPPTELPDLRRVGVIALDLETRDNRLDAKMGSGWPFADGHICGVSVAYRAGGDMRAHYFPLRHPDSNNFDPAQVYQWLRDLVAADVRIVTQNGLYDWGWLRAEADIGMPPAERLEEIGALATIVDENRFSYSLDALCAWRGLPGKDESALKEAAVAARHAEAGEAASLYLATAGALCRAVCRSRRRQHVGAVREPRPDPRSRRHARRLSARSRSVADGARDAPARHPHRCGRRRAGARSSAAKRDAVFAEISEKLGRHVGMAEIGRNKWLAETFDQHGIKYPRTAEGQSVASPPAIPAGCRRHPHWLPPLIVKADRLQQCRRQFPAELHSRPRRQWPHSCRNPSAPLRRRRHALAALLAIPTRRCN